MSSPRTLDGAVVLSGATVEPGMAAGKTRHVVGGEFANPRIRRLAIVQYEEQDAFYLFYCDGDWTVITDTCHDTVAEAIEQAEFEFEQVSFRADFVA